MFITNLVTHIVGTSGDFFKGMEHKHSWLFYHDALSIMTYDRKSWLLYAEGSSYGVFRCIHHTLHSAPPQTNEEQLGHLLKSLTLLATTVVSYWVLWVQCW